MSRAELERRANGLKLSWELEKIQIALNNLDTHHGKNVSAFLVATASDEKDAKQVHHLLQAEFNLSALRTRQEFARELDKRYRLFSPQTAESVKWDIIMEQVCVLGQQEAMKGTPAVEIVTNADEIVPGPEYLLEPFIVKGQANCLFGDGGTCKSFLSATFGLALALAWHDNPWSLRIGEARPLVLDWETDIDSWRYRCNRITRGHKLPSVILPYRHCFLPFADDIAPIQAMIDYYNANVLIIDSVGVACGGANLNESQTANGFFAALRRLNITSLLITHNPKNVPFGGDKSPMGSGYFTTTPRNVWQVKREQEAGENLVNLSCSDFKRNDFAKRLPIGFQLQFDNPNSSVQIDRINLDQTGFASDLPLRLRIKNLLSSGPRTAKDIADSLSVKPNTVQVRLSEMKALNAIIPLPGDKWGLAETRRE